MATTTTLKLLKTRKAMELKQKLEREFKGQNIIEVRKGRYPELGYNLNGLYLFKKQAGDIKTMGKLVGFGLNYDDLEENYYKKG